MEDSIIWDLFERDSNVSAYNRNVQLVFGQIQIPNEVFKLPSANRCSQEETYLFPPGPHFEVK